MGGRRRTFLALVFTCADLLVSLLSLFTYRFFRLFDYSYGHYVYGIAGQMTFLIFLPIGLSARYIDRLARFFRLFDYAHGHRVCGTHGHMTFLIFLRS